MNILVSIKRFFTNKNVVTIIGVILIIALLYWGYNSAIQSQVAPVSGIPIAREKILPATEITADMIDTISVAPIVLQKGDVYTTKDSVIGKYSNYDTAIPEGSMFYKSSVIDKEDLPDAALLDLKQGEVPFNLSVTVRSTFGNMIRPGNYIDIYLKAEENEEIIYGKFIENIEVLAVLDGKGQNVFGNSEETRTPSMMIFGLQPELNVLLNKAHYLSSNSVEIVPVPHGTAFTEPGATAVSTEYLREFIESKSVILEENNTES